MLCGSSRSSGCRSRRPCLSTVRVQIGCRPDTCQHVTSCRQCGKTADHRPAYRGARRDRCRPRVAPSCAVSPCQRAHRTSVQVRCNQTREAYYHHSDTVCRSVWQRPQPPAVRLTTPATYGPDKRLPVRCACPKSSQVAARNMPIHRLWRQPKGECGERYGLAGIPLSSL